MKGPWVHCGVSTWAAEGVWSQY